MSAIEPAELLALLNVAAHRADSLKAFAATANVSPLYLSDILIGQRAIPDFMAERVGYRARTIYEPIESDRENRPA